MRSLPGAFLLRQAGNKVYLLSSSDFGKNWSWALLPDSLQAGGLAVDPSAPGADHRLALELLGFDRPIAESDV